MKRILVPVDFSPTSERALCFAINIVSKSEGEVFLHHVYSPVENSDTDTEKKKRELSLNRQTEAVLMKRLQRFKKKSSDINSKVKVSTIVGHTPAIRSILKFSKQNRIDLIVMGTNAASDFKKAIFGSMAVSMLEKSNVPVLLVPEKFEWKEPEEFLFATNYQRAERQALIFTIALAKLYDADVTVVHLLDPYLHFSEEQQKDFSEYAFELQRTYSDCNLKFKELKTTEVSDTMEKLYDEIPYDVLVMVRRKKTFFENFFTKSFTKNMAYVTTQPLLIVPQEE